MSERYLLPMAQCPETGERVKSQDLTGARFTPRQRRLAEDVAQQIAAKLTQRTGRLWLPLVETYSPQPRRVS